MPPSTRSSRVGSSTPNSLANSSINGQSNANANGSKPIRSKPKSKAAAPAPTTVSRIQARARQPLSPSSPLKPASTSSRVSGSSQALNTSLSAHPRTDPLNALSVLLKLLTSLPQRIGGCQYKLTKDEHALAVYLVGILDPFVYHGARVLSPAVSAGSGSSNSLILRTPGFGLMDQPTEIIDAILSHVEAKKDLLAVGLGCKRLYDVVFPRHYEYRVIRCKVSNVEVWNHLVGNRSLARNVRRLEIVDERSSVSSSPSSSSTVAAARGTSQPLLIPHNIRQTSSDLESTDDELHLHKKHERYLSAALLRMSGLKELKWSCNHSPISIANVWHAIGVRAKGLRMLEVCDNLIFAPGTGIGTGNGGDSESSDEESASEGEGEGEGQGAKGVSRKGVMVHVGAKSLASMETVVFRSTPHIYGASKIPELSRISAMLNHCTNLKNLEITYIPPRTTTPSHTNALALAQGAGQGRARPLADDFLTSASAPRWPNLTTLTLTNLRCSSPTAISAFLSGHEALEVLHFVDVVVVQSQSASPLNLAEGSLPRLKEIKAPRDVIASVIECPLGPGGKGRRPLDVIKGFKLSGNASVPSSSAARVSPDTRFLTHLRSVGATIRRVEMVGWHDMEDIKRLTACVPHVQWLDIGRRIGGSGGGAGGGERDYDSRERERTGRDSRTGGSERERSRAAANPNANTSGTTSNMLEWTDILATLPELVTMHGVRFFYEVSAAAMGGGSGSNAVLQCSGGSGSSGGSLPPLSLSGSGSTSNDNTSSTGHHSHYDSLSFPSALPLLNPNISTMERSRLRKNDEIASLLAWKCPRLRRVDHWDGSAGGCGRVIVLIRDGFGAATCNGEKDKEMDGSAATGKGKGKGKERERERHGHGGEKEKEKEKVRWEVRRVKL